MHWVYTLPLWAAIVTFIGGSCLLCALGMYFVRPHGGGDITHNDVAGPIMTTVGTVLAVLLTFMVVTVWQEYDAAAQGADAEAAAIADLYHESFALPSSFGAPLRKDILSYLQVVVHDEWPLMKDGFESSDAERTAIKIVDAVQAYSPQTMGEQTAQADALRHVHNFLDARRGRLFNNSQSVPALVWTMMIFVAAVTITFAYFFRVANRRVHLMMILALGAVVGATFLMIAELDLPFSGPLQIDPHAFTHDIARLPLQH